MKTLRRVAVALLVSVCCNAQALAMTDTAERYLHDHLRDKNSAISRILAILDAQRLTYYRLGGEGAPALAINGRGLMLDRDGFIQVIANSLLQCGNVDGPAGTRQSQIQKACEDGTVSGFLDWAHVAADPKISEAAWYCGGQGAVGSDTNPDDMAIDFGGWAGRARVCQRRMDRER